MINHLFSKKIITQFVPVCIGAMLVGSCYCESGVIWDNPTLLYADYQDSYCNANAGVDLTSDGAGNALEIWIRSGTRDDKSVKIMSASSQNSGYSWSTPTVAVVPGEHFNPTEFEVGYAGSGKWLITWIVNRKNNIVEFYKSTSNDLGATWSAADFITSKTVTGNFEFVDDPPYQLKMAGDNNGTFIMSYKSKRLRTVDGGENWDYSEEPITYVWDGSSIVELNRWSNITYAGGQQWYHAFYRYRSGIGLTPVNHIYVTKSIDNGISWSEPVRLPFEYSRLSDIVANEISVVVSVFGAELEVQTVNSTDGGTSWSEATTFERRNPSKIILKDSNAALLIDSYKSTGGDVFDPIIASTSEDNGSSWTSIFDALPIGLVGDIVNVSPTDFLAAVEFPKNQPYSRKILAAGSSDFGSSWTLFPVVSDELIVPYKVHDDRLPAIDSNDAGRMITTWVSESSYEKKLLFSISDDLGQTWAESGLIEQDFQKYFASVPEIYYVDNSTWLSVWTSSNNNAAIRSRSVNNGNTWSTPEVFQTEVNNYNIWADNNSGTILGEVTGSLLNHYYIRSDDAGANMGYAADADFGRDVENLGGNNWLKVEDDSKAYISTDNAHTWSPRGMLNGIESAATIQISSNPDHSTILVVATFEPESSPLKIYRSVDVGLNWETVTIPSTIDLYASIKEVALKWLTGDTWIVAVGGLYPDVSDVRTFSIDDGQSWAAFQPGGPVNITVASDTAISVFSTYPTDNEPDAQPNKEIYAQRGILGSVAEAADWQLYQ